MTKILRALPLFLVFCAFPLLAAAQDQPPTASSPATPAPEAKAVDAKARAYYHFSLGHMYEELAGPFRRSDFMQRAVEEYKKALKFDHYAGEIAVRLAEAYRRGGLIREAVVEARQLLDADPDNLAAHRLLGQIYLQTLGDPGSGTGPESTRKLAIEEFEHIARLAPKDSEALALLGRLYRMDNDLQGAELAYRRLLEAEPSSDEGLVELSRLYLDQGKTDVAIALLEGAAEQSSQARVYGALGDAYQEAGETEKAVQAYRHALQRESDNLDVRRRLAETLLTDNQVEAATAEYEALVEADPQDAPSWLRLSQIYRHQRRFQKAERALRRAKTYNAESLEVDFNQALLHEQRGEFDAAIALLSEMLGRMTHPTGDYSAQEKRARAIVLERLGQVYREIEEYEESAEIFSLMLDLDEQAARRGYGHLAETLRQARRLDDAINTLRQARERFPDERDFRTRIASLLSEKGELETAVAMVHLLQQESGDDLQLQLTLAQIYERNRRYSEAEAAVDEAEELAANDTQREFVYFLRGALAERQKQYERAEREFRRVLELNAESHITLNYLGYMFADQNTKLKEAVELLERAVELDPQNGAYLDSLGWAYFRLEQFDKAERYLLRALERVSRDPVIHEHLGDLYFETGRLRLALQTWERARQEWEHATPTGLEPDKVAQLETKIQQLKLRLARKSKQKKGPN
ncbi:MAG: tetratricopeptide repeat protein [Terriglobia bacterium]